MLNPIFWKKCRSKGKHILGGERLQNAKYMSKYISKYCSKQIPMATSIIVSGNYVGAIMYVNSMRIGWKDNILRKYGTLKYCSLDLGRRNIVSLAGYIYFIKSPRVIAGVNALVRFRRKCHVHHHRHINFFFAVHYSLQTSRDEHMWKKISAAIMVIGGHVY